MNLNMNIVEELVDILEPLLRDERERTSRIEFLFMGAASRPSIDSSGASKDATRRIVSKLLDFGEIKTNVLAIEALLDSIYNEVGVDKQERIKKVKDTINSQKKSPSTQGLRKLNYDVLAEIVDILRPIMTNESDRKAFVKLTLGDEADKLLKIDYSSPSTSFLTHLVDGLFMLGKVHNKEALVTLLDIIYEDVDTERRARINQVKDILQAGLKEEPVKRKTSTISETPPSKPRIFVSYSRANETFARSICKFVQVAGLSNLDGYF